MKNTPGVPREPSSNGRKRAASRGPKLGIVEWFRPGEHERVERVIEEVRRLSVKHLRTGVSWADCHSADGWAWYDWLIPRLAEEVEVLPCFLYTPPSVGIAPKTCAPPAEPKAYADFVDAMVSSHDRHFDWVELWNEPNNVREWDWTLDADWLIFSQMIGGAAYWARQLGKKTLLGGMSPVDPNWLALMFERGVMDYIDAVGIHGFPDTFDFNWPGWDANVARVRKVLEENSSKSEIWITEAGFSTWRHDEHRQLREFTAALAAPVERLYWYSAQDLDPRLRTVDGFHNDEREYHFGLKRIDGTPKLLSRIWEQNGVAGVHDVARVFSGCGPEPSREKKVLITGGAGFVGTNLAHRLLRSGRSVVVYDNLSRPGVETNLEWLRRTHGEQVSVVVADVRDLHSLRQCVHQADSVYHLAAQVAVTTSLTSPTDDFDINARGTLNLLEAMRDADEPPSLLFTSTNKVYGALDWVRLSQDGERYQPVDARILASGIGEDCQLDFHSPYGCSKGAADQYVIDYSRSYGLKTVVFRMSCIYGPHQMGTEDQGWVAHFLIRAIEGRPITIYGDGMQVRDVLFVEDLVDAFLLAQSRIDRLHGRAFNIGGGPSNTTSLLELVERIEALQGRQPAISFDEWRTGDQRYYVSDTSAFRKAAGWAPRRPLDEGLELLYEWLLKTRAIPRPAAPGKESEQCPLSSIEPTLEKPVIRG